MTITILKDKPIKLQVTRKELTEIESETPIIKNNTMTSIVLNVINTIFSFAVLIVVITLASLYIVDDGMWVFTLTLFLLGGLSLVSIYQSYNNIHLNENLFTFTYVSTIMTMFLPILLFFNLKKEMTLSGIFLEEKTYSKEF
jgi:hypothetical protein